VSTGAKSCPHCGKKNPTVSPAQRIVGAVIVVAVLGYCMSIFNSTSTTQPGAALSSPAATVVGSVTAMDLARAYHANEVAADNTYKNQVYQISGVVESINKNFMDETYLVLRTDNMFNSVHAELKSSELGMAANLSKGTSVTVTCRIKGMVIGSPMADDCVF
jgi:hypothetical protein